MNRLIYISIALSFLFQVNFVFGQQVEMDTVFVKRSVGENEFIIDTITIPAGKSSTQVLTGTTFLPYSDNMIGLLNHGLSPVSLTIIEECDQNFDPKSAEKYPFFRKVSRDSNQLIIDVTIVSNCCHNFLGEATVLDDTLKLIYTAYGGFCSCTCCFTLRYIFDTTFEADYHMLKFLTINESRIVEPIPK